MPDKCEFPCCRSNDFPGKKYCIGHDKLFGGQKVPDKPKPIAKVSEKKKAEIKENKGQKDTQDAWFEKKVSQMTGKCMECGGKTKSNLFVYSKMAIAHVLPKRKSMFPSVATHEENSLELCATNGCHAKYDSSWDAASTMKVWPLAVEKFKIMYPSIAANEKRNIPDILLQEVEPV